MAKQKTVGHSAGSVIPHEMMEQWIEEVENLEASQHEPIVMWRDDIDEFLAEMENDGWVFSNKKWRKYGWRSRTTKELYYLFQRDKERFGT